MKRLWKWVRGLVGSHGLLRSGGFWFTVLVTGLLVSGVALSLIYWDWLRSGTETQESVSTTLRNLGLMFAGVIALPLAVWRSWVAERQARTAQQDLLNDRYQKGAEMLGNEVLSVRLGGIYALQRLAEEHPEQYHIQIMNLFCEFARYPTEDSKLYQEPQGVESCTKIAQGFEGTKQYTLEIMGLDEPSLRMREDIKAVVSAIRERGQNGIKLEREAELRLDLSYSDLRHSFFLDADLSSAVLVNAKLHRANLIGSILSNAYLLDAKLQRAYLVGAKLSGARLHYANLCCASLMDADLCDAVLVDANLSGTDLRAVKNLTQGQLDGARADPNKPPYLVSAVDAETGKPLEWRGKPLNDEA